jgi:hypothetical protein
MAGANLATLGAGTDGDNCLERMELALGSVARANVVEAALAAALVQAATAGRWEVVGQLARELEARRLAASDSGRAKAPDAMD